MAKTYEEMKKAYETARKAIEECHAEIKNNERMVGQTAGIIQEGAKEIGLRVQQLKDGGATGTDIAAFQGDAEVKKMLAEVNNFFASLDKELKQIATAHAAAKTKHVKAFWDTKTALEAEIKDRKKAVSTKLGTGNKSLPDMEKMLADMNKFKDSAAFVGVDAFEPETVDSHKREFNFQVKDQIASTKQAKLSAQQQMLDEQALNERNLAKHVGVGKTSVAAAVAAEKSAKEAVAKKDGGALNAAKVEAAKALKAVSDIDQIFDRAYADDWIRSKINASKIKGKIDGTAKSIKETAKALDAIAKRVAALKV